MRLSPTRAAGAALLLATGISGCGSSGETTTPVVVTVSVSPSPLTLNQAGATGQLIAALLDQSGRPISGVVTWSVQNAAVATVSGNGLTATVTGVSRGATLVIARSTSDTTRSGSVLVTVLGVISVVVSPKTITLDRGATQTLNAAVTADPGVSTALTWRSSSTAISVSNAGLVRALNPGVGYVVAAPVAEPQKQDSALVTVPNACLTPTDYTLGTTIAASITAADCGGAIDLYRFSPASQALYVVTARTSLLMSVSPLSSELVWGLTRFSSSPDSIVLHVLASAGAHQMGVSANDSTQRGPYTLSTQLVQALPASCPNVFASRGVSLTFTVGTSCLSYLVTQGPPLEVARAQLLFVTIAGNAVYRVSAVSQTAAARVSLHDASNLQTPVVTVTATAAGSPAVLTYSNTGNQPIGFYLLIFGPSSGATTNVTVTIDP